MRRGWIAVDTETTALNEMRADLVGISLCVEPGEACYIPLAHRGPASAGADDLFSEKADDRSPKGRSGSTPPWPR